jgi:hypothetical protein
MGSGRWRRALRRSAGTGQPGPADAVGENAHGLAVTRRASRSRARKVVRPVRDVPEAVGGVLEVALEIAIDVAQNMLP